MPVNPRRIVLLVEDEAMIAVAQRRALESAGYQVSVAHSGEEALTLISESLKPDLVLMDIDLGPGMDGAEAAQRILEKENLPVVFLSSHAEGEVVARTEGISSYGFIPKSAAETVLIASIRVALQLWDAHQINARTTALQSNLFEQVPGALYQYQYFPDGSSCFPMASRNICLVYEVTPEEVKNDATPVFRRVHPEDFDSVVASIVHSYQTLETWEHDYRVILPSRGERWLRGRAKPEQRPDGSVLWHGFITDITDYKAMEARANRQLEQSESRYRALFENSSSIMLVIDPEDGRILRANSSAARFYGWTTDVLTSMNIHEINQAPAPHVMLNMTSARDWEQNVFHFRHRIASGASRDVEVFSSPIHWDGREVLHSIIHDVTKRSELESERARLSTAVEQSADVVVITDINGFIEYANPRFSQLTGYRVDEVIGKKTNIMDSAAHTQQDYARLWETILSGEVWRGTFHNRKKSGERYWESASIAPIFDGEGAITSFVKIAEDITERMAREQLLKETAQQLQEAVSRQETLMAELNHRVKNNLAMVASLVRLEDKRLGQAADLTDILTRINTITAIHQQLQDSSTYDSVDLRPYISQVVSNAVGTQPGVQLDLDLESIFVTTKSATTIGLIMNEIATNAVKYGFNRSEPARFSVVSRRDGSFCRITATNSGNPFPEDIDLEDTASLGLRLVSMLIHQIDGEVDLTRIPQAQYTIRFPLEPGE